MNHALMKSKAGHPFEPVGTSAEIWTDFLIWWTVRWPGRCLPCKHGLHNLCGLTGLSKTQVAELLEKQTPPALTPLKNSIPKIAFQNC